MPRVNWEILGIEMMTLWASLNQHSGIIFLITVEWNSRVEQRWLLPRYRGHQSGEITTYSGAYWKLFSGYSHAWIFYLGRSYITKNSHVGKHHSLSLLNYADLLQSPHADPLYSFRASVVRYLFCITSHNASRGGQYS